MQDWPNIEAHQPMSDAGSRRTLVVVSVPYATRRIEQHRSLPRCFQQDCVRALKRRRANPGAV